MLSKLFNNKKGNDGDIALASSSVQYYIFALVITIIAIGVYVGFTANFANSYAPIPDGLVLDVSVARLTNVCFSYEDESRVYQNVIELDSFTQANLELCFTGTVIDPLKLQLRSLDDSFEGQELQLGFSSFRDSQQKYVLVKLTDSNEFTPAILEVFYDE